MTLTGLPPSPHHLAVWPAALRAALEVVYSTQDIWVGLPYVIITAAVSTVGIVLWILFMALVEYVLLPDQRRRQAIIIANPKKKGALEWIWRPWRLGSNTIQFILKLLFMIGLGFIIWIAGATAGFNPWTTAVASMGIMVLVTYTFITPLGMWGTGVALNYANSINVGEYWELEGPGGWDGIITGVYAFEVEMMRLDEEGATEIISVPITHFMQSRRKHKPGKDFYAPRAYSLQGEHQWREIPAADVAALSIKHSRAAALKEPPRASEGASGRKGAIQASPAQAAAKINHRLHYAPELIV